MCGFSIRLRIEGAASVSISRDILERKSGTLGMDPTQNGGTNAVARRN
jgi:hypothetical protein